MQRPIWGWERRWFHPNVLQMPFRLWKNMKSLLQTARRDTSNWRLRTRESERKDDANREAALQRDTAASLEKVRRRVAEGLLEKQDSQGDSQSPDQPK